MQRKNSNVCDVFCYDEEKVNRIRGELVATEEIARVFKALADETRLKIIYSLAREELCVCDMAQITGISVAAASHHLRLLKHLGLAKSRKEGKMVFYSLQDQCVRIIIETALNHHSGAHEERIMPENCGGKLK